MDPDPPRCPTGNATRASQPQPQSWPFRCLKTRDRKRDVDRFTSKLNTKRKFSLSHRFSHGHPWSHSPQYNECADEESFDTSCDHAWCVGVTTWKPLDVGRLALGEVRHDRRDLSPPWLNLLSPKIFSMSNFLFFAVRKWKKSVVFLCLLRYSSTYSYIFARFFLFSSCQVRQTHTPRGDPQSHTQTEGQTQRWTLALHAFIIRRW